MFGKNSAIRIFSISFFATIICFIAGYWIAGISVLGTLITLMVVSVSISMDSAIINAKKLSKLSRYWQIIFLTLGIIIAVFAMRFILPVAIVSVVTRLSWIEVVKLAFYNPSQYAIHLKSVYPIIASFGGAYLLTLTLTYFCCQNKKNFWIKPFEKYLSKYNKIFYPPIVAFFVIILMLLLPSSYESSKTTIAGVLGIICFLIINWLTTYLENLHFKHNQINKPKTGKITGFAAFVSFIYLELLDDSFSLESIVSAFAITDQVALMVVGLGVGAIWVRSMTIYFIRKKTDNKYLFLETAAHYIMFVLSFVLFSEQFFEFPHIFIAILIILIIILAIISSPKQKLSIK